MAKYKFRKKTSDISKQMLKGIASHYANVACPLFTYQAHVGKDVKKLRKF